nr:immunoglobulin light chain junction region [Macaca mulatta]
DYQCMIDHGRAVLF